MFPLRIITILMFFLVSGISHAISSDLQAEDSSFTLKNYTELPEQLSPMDIPGATTVNTEQAKRLFDQEIPFIDVRGDSAWHAGHIPRAHHLEEISQFNKKNFSKIVKRKSDPAVIYCHGERCKKSARVVEKTLAWGYRDIYYYREGFKNWKQAGHPIEYGDRDNLLKQSKKKSPISELSKSVFLNIDKSVHIPKTTYLARNDLNQIHIPEFLSLNKQKPLVSYCFYPTCEQASWQLKQLQQRGFENVSCLQGSFQDWQNANHPIARKTEPDNDYPKPPSHFESLVLAQILFEQNAQFIDLADEQQWNNGHIAGAFWQGDLFQLGLTDAELEKRLGKKLKQDLPIVLYCHQKICSHEQEVAKQLIRFGYREPYHFEQGYQHWYKEGLPVFPNSAVLNAQQQILQLSQDEFLQYALSRGDIIELSDKTQSSIPTARVTLLNILKGEFNQSNIVQKFPQASLITLVCHNELCHDIRALARQLIGWGFNTVFYFQPKKIKAQQQLDDLTQELAIELPLSGEISLAESWQLYQEGAFFVDVGDTQDWNTAHISMARHASVSNNKELKLLLKQWFNTDDKIVFYCASAQCEQGKQALKLATESGFKRSYFFTDGLDIWQTSQFPVLPRVSQPDVVTYIPLNIVKKIQSFGNSQIIELRKNSPLGDLLGSFSLDFSAKRGKSLRYYLNQLERVPAVFHRKFENNLIFLIEPEQLLLLENIAEALSARGFKHFYYSDDHIAEKANISSDNCRDITSSYAKFQQGATFVSEYPYVRASHFIGDKMGQLDKQEMRSIAGVKDSIQIYCLDDSLCHDEAMKLKRQMRQWGYRRVSYLKDWRNNKDLRANNLIQYQSSQQMNANSEIKKSVIEPPKKRKEIAQKIDVKQAYQLFKQYALFIDLRGAKAWSEGHIMASMPANADDLDENTLSELFKENNTIVFFCQDRKCIPEDLIERLKVGGFSNSYLFESGFNAWKKASYPIQ